MIEISPEVNHLFPALISAQSKMRGVVKDSNNPHFRSSYASLENVIDTARGPLNEDGIAFTQAPGALVDGAIEITTMLMHRSGQWLRSTLHVPLQKRDPQGVGSAITYGCRYALMATLGLPPVDDDGESAMDRNNQSAPMTGRTSYGAGSLRTQDKPAGNHSEAYNVAISAMKLSKSREELRQWYFANKANLAKALEPADAQALKAEMDAFGLTLPEKVAA